MNAVEKIKNISNLKNESVEYLKKSDLPLVLYGAGDLASNCKIVLDKNNIKIDSVVVDKEYLQPDMKFYGYEVETLENVLANNSKINIVVAFIADGKYMEKTARLNNNSNVQRCVFFDMAVFFPLLHNFDFDFFDKNSLILTDLYNYFQDDLSRRLMLEYMKAVNLTDSRDLIKLNVANELQYFPDFLPLSDNETFVDCGAYTGDTIRAFLNKTNSKFNKIFAFEPDPSNYAKCEKFVANCGRDEDIVLIEKGVLKEKKAVAFKMNNYSYSSYIGESGDIKVETDSIDNVCRNEKVTFIKMDVEGSELEALKGAKSQIKTNKPKLAVCVYHKKEDLVTIPQYILSLNPDYKLYLRHYGSFCVELVLYAV